MNKEKELLHLIYLENEKIKLSKKKIKLLREQLNRLYDNKGRILKKGKEYDRRTFNN